MNPTVWIVGTAAAIAAPLLWFVLCRRIARRFRDSRAVWVVGSLVALAMPWVYLAVCWWLANR